MLELNTQTGCLHLSSGDELKLTPDEMVLFYWTMLDAPLHRIAKAAQRETADIRAGLGSLADRLGAEWKNVKDAHVTFLVGTAPCSSLPWSERHCAALLSHGLNQRAADSPFLYTAGAGVLTLADIVEMVARIRAGLATAKLQPGDRIAIDAAPRLETYLVTLAALAHGVVVVRLGETMGAETLRGMILTAPAKMTFTARRAMLANLSEAGRIVDLPGVDNSSGPADFNSWLSAAPEPGVVERTPAAVRPDDPAVIGFTSGSTGAPKAVILTHESVFRSGEHTQNTLCFSQDDIFCSATDLTSNMSTFMVLTLPLLSGGRLILPSKEARSNPAALALDAEQYGVTVLMTVPSGLRTLMLLEDKGGPRRLASVRTLLNSTGPLDRPTADTFHTYYPGCRIADVMGAREANTLLQSDGTNGALMSSGGGNPVESLFRLLDADGMPVTPGETGEIFLHSDCLMAGYLPPPGAFATADDHSGPAPVWFGSGDLARMNAEGRIEIVGRSKDIIKAPDGSIVYPIEVEAVLNDCKVVRESCVFLARDSAGIEYVGAAVIPVDDSVDGTSLERQLQNAVQTALGRFKTPRHILMLDDFPRVGRAKPNRRALGELMAADVANSGGIENEF